MVRRASHSSVLAIDGMVVLGSKDGTWCLGGGHRGAWPILKSDRMRGLVTNLVSMEKVRKMIFAGASPGDS